MTNFKSIANAVSIEKTMNKGCATLVADFVADILAANAAAVKDALKKALKTAGFTPSNCFVMKSFNTAVAIAAATIVPEDVAVVMSYCKIKAAEGEKIAAAKILTAIEKNGGLYTAMLKSAKDAAQPAAKKAAKIAAAKKGAQTRAAKKGGIIPAAVRQAAIAADSVKNAESPRQQAATPAARLDRAINAFLALDDEGKAAFAAAVRQELNAAILTASKAKKKVA